jgi:hypothetical protein
LNRSHFPGASLATTAAYAAGVCAPARAQKAPNRGTPTLPAFGLRCLSVGVVELISLLPHWAVPFDIDAEAARKVRHDTFQRIVAAKALVGGFHFPWPALGRMEASGKGDAFQPLADV